MPSPHSRFKELDALSRQYGPAVFRERVLALGFNETPPPGHPRWVAWIDRVLRTPESERSFLSAEMLAWFDSCVPGVFARDGENSKGTSQRLWARLTQWNLSQEEQDGTAWLIRHGAVHRPGISMVTQFLDKALSKAWWGVAHALLDLDGGRLRATLGRGMHDGGTVRTAEAWDHAVRHGWLDPMQEVWARTVPAAIAPTEQRRLHPAVPAGGAFADAEAQCADAVLPLWANLAVDGLEAAWEWGKVHDPSRLEEAAAWRSARACALAIQPHPRNSKKATQALRAHPGGLQGCRPGTDIPEAWLAIAADAAVFDWLSEAELASIPAGPYGQSLWHALARTNALNVQRAAVLERAGIPLRCDDRGRGLLTALPRMGWAVGANSLDTAPALAGHAARCPEVIWGKSPSEESAWLADGERPSELTHRCILELARLHPEPEAVSGALRGAWAMAALAQTDRPAGPEVRRWMNAGVALPAGFLEAPPPDAPSASFQVRAHKRGDWPEIQTLLQLGLDRQALHEALRAAPASRRHRM